MDSTPRAGESSKHTLPTHLQGPFRVAQVAPVGTPRLAGARRTRVEDRAGLRLEPPAAPRHPSPGHALDAGDVVANRDPLAPVKRSNRNRAG